MAEQYLRLKIAGVNYLLPGGAGYAIEQRESLQLERGGGPVVAWRTARGGARAPAYCLDSSLRITRRDDWLRVVFLGTGTAAAGIVVDEVQLMPRGETQVTPFTPLGPSATRAGHLFSAAWVTGQHVTLVFEPQALQAYLQGLGAGAP